MVKLLSDQSTRPWAICRRRQRLRYRANFAQSTRLHRCPFSYRKIEQLIAACRTLIRRCRNLPTLHALWSTILQEAERYTEEGIARLEAIWQQQYTDLYNRPF